MKKLILLVLFVFVPVFASAATITLDDVLGVLPNFGTESIKNTTSIGDMLKLLGVGANVDVVASPSHEDYIKKFIFPPSATSTVDVVEIATKIFGGKSIKKLANCVDTEFNRVWSSGGYGEEVRELQRFLNQNKRTRIATDGPGSPGAETLYFGALTVDAVKRFQTLFAKDILETVGLKEATGFWGPSTIKKANEITALCK